MLISKRVQGVYFNESAAQDLTRNMYLNESLIRHSKYPAFQYVYHLFSIKYPNLVKVFNAFLISHAKQVTAIHNRYGLK
jgi:hypothetical protein